MILQHTINSIRLLAAACLIPLITITFLTDTVKGSNSKSEDWSNAYNQHFYSDLTGTIRELTSNDNNDYTDTRFQPPLDTNNKKAQPIAEGLLVASADIIAPSISISLSKETSHERHKREGVVENSSIPTVSLPSINTEQILPGLSNNAADNEPIMNDADSNLWARVLSLSTVLDGSGNEPETTSGTEATESTPVAPTTIELTTIETTPYSIIESYSTEGEYTSIGTEQTSFTSVSSETATITSFQSIQTEETILTDTATPITSSAVTENVTETVVTETSPVIETETATTSEMVTESTTEQQIVTVTEGSTGEVSSTETTPVTETETAATSEIVTESTTESQTVISTEGPTIVQVSSTEISPVTETETAATSEIVTESTTESQTVISTEGPTIGQVSSTETSPVIETETATTSEMVTESTTESQTVISTEGPTIGQVSSTEISPVTATETAATSEMVTESTTEQQIVTVTEGSTGEVSSTETTPVIETETAVTSEMVTEPTTEQQIVTVTEGSTGEASSTETSPVTETETAATSEIVTESTTESQTVISTEGPTIGQVSSTEISPVTETETAATSEMVTESTTEQQIVIVTEGSTGEVSSTETSPVTETETAATSEIVTELTTESQTVISTEGPTIVQVSSTEISPVTETETAATSEMVTESTTEQQIVTITEGSTGEVSSTETSPVTETETAATSEIVTESTTESQTVISTEGPTIGQVSSTETSPVTETETAATSEIVTESSTESQTVISTEGPTIGEVSSTETTPVTETETAATSEMVTESTTEQQIVTITEGSTGEVSSIETTPVTETETAATSEILTESTTESQTVISTEGTTISQISSTETSQEQSTTGETETESVSPTEALVTLSSTESSTITSSETGTVSSISESTTEISSLETMSVSAASISEITTQAPTETEAATVSIETTTISEIESSITSTTPVQSTSETSLSITTTEGMETMSTSESESTLSTESSTVYPSSTVSQSSVETSESTTESTTLTVQTVTESISSTETTETTGIYSVSESEMTSSSSTLSTITITETSSSATLSTELVTEAILTSETSSSSSSTTLSSESSAQTLESTERTSLATETESETSSTATTTETGTFTESTITASSTEITTESPENPTSFFLYFNYISSGSRFRRAIPIDSPRSSTIENEVANILFGMNITCNDTCIRVSQTSVVPPDVEYLVQLNVPLDIPERIELVNGFFANNVSLNDSYRLTVRIIMNDRTGELLNFTTFTPACKECEFAFTGNCTSDNNGCVCNPNYEGQYCRNLVQATTIYLPTSITISTLSSIAPTSTISTIQASVTLTTSTITESELSTSYSTFTPVTITTETGGTETESITTTSLSTESVLTSESMTSETFLSTSSIVTNTLSSSTTTESITQEQTIEATTTVSAATVEITSSPVSITASTTTESITQEQTIEATTTVSAATVEITSSPVSITTSATTESITQEQTIEATTTTIEATTTVSAATVEITSSPVSITASTTTESITQEQTIEATTTVSAATVEITSSPASITTSTTAATQTYESTTLTMTAETAGSTITQTTEAISSTEVTVTQVTGSTTIETISTRITPTTIITTEMETVASTTSTETSSIQSATSTPITLSTAETQTGQSTTIVSSSTATTTPSSIQTETVEITTAGIGTTVSTSTPMTVITTTTVTEIVSTLTVSEGTASSSNVPTSVTAIETTVVSSPTTVTVEISTLMVTTETTSSITSTSSFTTASTIVIATTTQMTTITSTSTTTTISTTTTSAPQVCMWTDRVIISPCSATCGEAFRLTSRSCVNSITGQNCSSLACGTESAIQNESCSASPPCEKCIFFEQHYNRIWVTNKGYISFGLPFYSRTMTRFAFFQLFDQAIAAPFWADLDYYTNNSSITIDWYNSLSANQTNANVYNAVIQQAVSESCPVQICPTNFAAVRVVRISWKNLYSSPSAISSPISLSFSAYLINTYEVGFYSYPNLRSYLAFDYTNLSRNLGYLKPFVGYRGKSSLIKIFNDPYFYQNALFLTQSSRKTFYVGGRSLSVCEIYYLQETNSNNLDPSNNLNDVVNNPRFPCPCSIGQAFGDNRFAQLFSETPYERSQGLICFGPRMTIWVPFWTSTTFYWKQLRSQTCCYNQFNGGLITYGDLAGSVLSDPNILFQPYPWLKRIAFHDQCCLSRNIRATENENNCHFYYQLHPASTCTGYQTPARISGNGDPHINTIDNGRYTCHIQGIYVFARTSNNANATAQFNLNNSGVFDENLIYPDDLFQISVRSISIPAALPYIQIQGSASLFSSYSVVAGNYTFNISNNNGKFGFVANNGSSSLSLTESLADNLNYDNANTMNYNDRYFYRVQQTVVSLGSITVAQLTFALWSGVTMQCQIVSENLDCILSLPRKYRTYIEGLVGNFNGNYSDDLVNRQTNQTVIISSATNRTAISNDTSVLRACLSWKLSTDTTPNMANPIMPSYLVYTYYNQYANTLASLNSLLNQSEIDRTCSTNFECRHDYIIRINPISSGITASSLNSFQQIGIILAEIVPTISISPTIQIGIPYNDLNRMYTLPITVADAKSTLVTISQNGSMTNSSFNGASIMIPIPNNSTSFVQVFLTISYGTNSTLIQYLNIIACLCANTSYCNYGETRRINDNYELAACRCPDQYEGDFCENPYNGCNSGSACRINWNNGTICNPLNATDQVAQNRSYTCNGTCQNGYSSTNNYTCDDIDECQRNSSRCGNGVCINLIGTFTCNCSNGYRFENQTCIDINECREPNVDGTFGVRCNVTDACINTNGNYTCQCSPIFNTTGTCLFNETLCNGDTCRLNGMILCLRGTIEENNTCVPWCNSTCPGFCEMVNNISYQCNCSKFPGYRHSDDGKQCLPCYELNYGYGCNQICNCTYGDCYPNATSPAGSCICDGTHEGIFCDRSIDMCARNNICNNATEDCVTDPSSGNATCSCKNGYQRITPMSNCTDVNECIDQLDFCVDDISRCNNIIGNYTCDCLDGYQSIDGSCFDINECNMTQTICSNYSNTYCANTPGSYECRCSFNYSLGGDYTQQYGNARNSNSSCLLTNYSALCANQCMEPASCSSRTGQCECPSSNYNLVVYALDNTQQTCQCPGHPFAYYNGTTCINATGQTWLIINLIYNPRSRTVIIRAPNSTRITNRIADFLFNMNITCNGSCITIYDTQSLVPPELQIMVTIDAPMSISQRIEFANKVFDEERIYDDDHTTRLIQMIMDPSSNRLFNITRRLVPCDECEFSDRGRCYSNNSGCQCYTGFEGDFCRIVSATTVAPTPVLSDRNWTIIIAVISAVAGLLLIISIAMCIFFIIKQRNIPSTKPELPSTRQQFTIPRAHIPTMGTGNRDLNRLDDFSLDNTHDEPYVDASDSLPSSTNTTYNTTYRATGNRPEADFGIFDELENRIPLSKGQIPRPQMANMMGTLNSLPAHERFDGPLGEASTFSDSRELDDIELVTDMVDDMTKDDDMEDEFVEALNPNLVMPRLALQPEMKSSGWFSFFRHS
ncbi:unnamed protein product [Rotaria sordida]|uniref:EGF-like domain-containing protein n=1 Tax=Rotaria sordida TaxID=392033 RepID=A0A815KM72_9BILA|nr:unnamed protein product [Rotaria sordida]